MEREQTLEKPRSLSSRKSGELLPTISNPWKLPRRKPTSVRSLTRNRSRPSPLSRSRLRPELSLPTSQFKSSRRRLTDLRMNLFLNKRSSRPSLKSWSRLSLKCLATKQYHKHSFLLLYLWNNVPELLESQLCTS